MNRFLGRSYGSSSSDMEERSLSQPLLEECPSVREEIATTAEEKSLHDLSAMFSSLDVQTIRQTLSDERNRILRATEASTYPSLSPPTSSPHPSPPSSCNAFDDAIFHASVERLMLLQGNGVVHTELSSEPICICDTVGEATHADGGQPTADVNSAEVSPINRGNEVITIDPQQALSSVDLLRDPEVSVASCDLEGTVDVVTESSVDDLKEIIVCALDEVGKIIPLSVRVRCLEVLGKLIGNILSNPSNPQFRCFKLSNKTIAASVAPHESALTFLQVVGFNPQEAVDGGIDVLRVVDPSFTLLQFAKEKIASLLQIPDHRPATDITDSRVPSLSASPSVVSSSHPSSSSSVCSDKNPRSSSSSFAFSSRSRASNSEEQNRQKFFEQLSAARHEAAERKSKAESGNRQSRASDGNFRLRGMTPEETQKHLRDMHENEPCESITHTNSRTGFSQKVVMSSGRSNGGRGPLRFSGFGVHSRGSSSGSSAARSYGALTPTVEEGFAATYRRITLQNSPARSLSDLRLIDFDPDYVGRQALDFTNTYRRSLDLPILFWSENLCQLGVEHSKNMGHGIVPVGHDGVQERFARFEFRSVRSAENVAFNEGVFEVAQTAVQQWIKSPGHEKNLRGDFTVCGIGVYRSHRGAFYLTQLFGSHG